MERHWRCINDKLGLLEAVGEVDLAVYGASSKAGMIPVCETVAPGEPRAITAISPSYVDTPMSAWKRDTLDQDAMLNTKDVAELALTI